MDLKYPVVSNALNTMFCVVVYYVCHSLIDTVGKPQATIVGLSLHAVCLLNRAESLNSLLLCDISIVLLTTSGVMFFSLYRTSIGTAVKMHAIFI